MADNLVGSVAKEVLLTPLTSKVDAYIDKQVEGETFDRAQRWTLLGIAVAAYAAGHLASGAVGLFAEPGFGASLLIDPSPAIATVKAAAIALLVGIAATFAGKSLRPDAGLFAAAVALLAVRRSGGLAQNVYLAQPTGRTLIALAVETLAIGAVLGIVFVVSRRAVAMKMIPDDAALDGVRPADEPLGQKLLALATHALVVAVGMLFICRSDAPMQVTASLFVCSLVAAICTVRFVPATPSCFFWLGPILAGVVAYLITSLSPGTNLSIGEPGGYVGTLARAMPLDWASAGVAGALYGYWVGRKHLPEPATP